MLLIDLFIVFGFVFGEDAFEFQGLGSAVGAFEAALAARVVNAYFRLASEFAHVMATLAVGAFFGIEVEVKDGDPVEERENCTERAEYSAPWSLYEEDGN